MTGKLQMDKFTITAIHTLLENSSDMIFFKDVDLVYRAASKPFAQMVGYEKGEDLIGKTDDMIFSPELTRKYTADDREILRSGVSLASYIEPLPDENGAKKLSSTSKFVIRNEAGEVIGICGVAKDVTAQMELKEERERREQSRRLFEDILEADLTENKMLRAENSMWAKTVGVVNADTFSESVKVFAEKYVHKDYEEEYIAHYDIDKLAAQYKNGVEEFSHLVYHRIGQGMYKWVELNSRLYYSQVTETLRIITVVRDLDDEMKTRENLKRKAEIDALTGLLNREHTIIEIERCLKTYPDQKHFLLCLDLDNFKEINDTMGHPFGDMILRRISSNLKQVFRNEDIAGRIGGDEFLVLLKDVPSKEIVMERMAHIFDKLGVCHCDDECKFNVTCSIGVSECAIGKSFHQVYQEADQAMYTAKHNGKNKYAFFE